MIDQSESFDGTARTLLFSVNVQSGDYGKGMSQKDWDRIAKRLERAAQGRAKERVVRVGPQLVPLS